jgi:hypothetical protein
MFGDLPRDRRGVDRSRLSPPGLAFSSRFETSPRTKRMNISSKPPVL